MRTLGSQKRETLKESGYVLDRRPQPGDVVLRDAATGRIELWHVNDHHAGYTIQIGRWGYEFCRSFSPERGWTADARHRPHDRASAPRKTTCTTPLRTT